MVLLLIVPFTVGGDFVFGSCFVNALHNLVCNPLAEEESASCFTLIKDDNYCHLESCGCKCIVFLLHSAWVGLQWLLTLIRFVPP